MRALLTCLLAALLAWAAPAAADDWPTVHHDAQRGGFTANCVRGPYRLAWVAEFPNEVVCTRVEAIVADGRVFVGTCNGTLWALDGATGKPLWKHAADGPIQHSPAVAGGRVFFGDAGGSLWALDAATGKPAWRFRSGKGGFVASPLVAGQTSLPMAPFGQARTRFRRLAVGRGADGLPRLARRHLLRRRHGHRTSPVARTGAGAVSIRGCDEKHFCSPPHEQKPPPDVPAGQALASPRTFLFIDFLHPLFTSS